jgi:hypothetical protein
MWSHSTVFSHDSNVLLSIHLIRDVLFIQLLRFIATFVGYKQTNSIFMSILLNRFSSDLLLQMNFYVHFIESLFV